MTDRPILFSETLIRALLAGRKTQTRRSVTSPLRQCRIGDRLWTRERWCVSTTHDETPPAKLEPRSMTVMFDASGSIANQTERGDWRPAAWPERVSQRPKWMGRWRAAMHQPRWASRFTLTVTDVRRQRLFDITQDDAIAEGLLDTTAGELRRMECVNEDGEPSCPADWPDDMVLWTSGLDSEEIGLHPDPRQAFFELWRTLHPEDDDNPEILALTFEVALGNIDVLHQQVAAAA